MKAILLAFTILLLLPPTAQAQQKYCAMYYDGTQSCGIPTLQSCEQSVLGVGGTCQIDDSEEIPENLFQRWRGAQQADQKPSSPALDDVPPPPGLSLTPTGPVGPPPQMYCAQYSDGTSSCGIPSLRECEDSVRGVGGVCRNQ